MLSWFSRVRGRAGQLLHRFAQWVGARRYGGLTPGIARVSVMTPDIRPEEPVLDAAAPYENDWIGFDEFGAGLTRLTQYGSGSGVVLVDGQWGWGKTTFANMWASSMRSEGRIVVQVNAWTGDYADSPFDDIVEQLRRGLREQNKGRAPLATAAVATTAGTLILSWAGGVRALQGFVEFVDPTAIAPTARLVWALGRAARGVARQQARRMKRLKRRLAKAVPRHYGRRRLKSLVVVVDELDRCRPDYALRFLETIKHVFEVPNVTFIVTANAEELANAVNGVYGAKFDGKGYVERFFDILLRLPLGDRANFVSCCLEETGGFRSAAGKDVVFDTQGCRREAPDVQPVYCVRVP